ncbi:MAG: hypothetical protein J7I99_01015, partial [Methanophagales archaeon]|nr:hypothetical protein [Methanophagales archaeon]
KSGKEKCTHIRTMLCYDNDFGIYVSLFGKKYVIVCYTQPDATHISLLFPFVPGLLNLWGAPQLMRWEFTASGMAISNTPSS